MKRDRLMEHLRSAGILAVWVLGTIIVWRIVLSIDAVQRAGFAVAPWRSSVYPAGLPWISFVDAGFLTLLIVVVLALGLHLRDFAYHAFPRTRAIGAIMRLLGVLFAVVIGNYAYDDFVYSPLFWQDLGWIYRLAFWLLIAGLAVIILLQVIRAWYELGYPTPAFVRTAVRLATGVEEPRSSRDIILRPQAPVSPETPTAPVARQQESPADRRCTQCQAILPKDARFCIKCGAQAAADIPDIPE